VIKKLPPESFAYYVALGPARSFQAVADHFEVNRRTVVRSAEREDWNTRVAAIEGEARRTADAKLASEMADMHLRHRKILTAVAARAARALQEYPLTTGMEGIKAAEIAIKLERLLAGEPTDRTAMDVEAITKRELRELLILGGKEEDAESPPQDEVAGG